MLRKQVIIVGKYYVNKSRKVAREVLGADDQTVKFMTYHLDTRNSCGSTSECTRLDFMNWADRVQSQEMEAQFRAPQFPNRDELEADASPVEKTSIMR